MKTTVRKYVALGFLLAANMVFADTATFSIAMTSDPVKDGGELPMQYTCDGTNEQPTFAWSNVPTNTQSFALILADPDAPNATFYHWVIYNIPAAETNLTAKFPLGTIIANNSLNKTAYNGPCPPKGKIHHYVFTLYALNTALTLPANANAATVLAAMQTHVLGETKLTLTYTRAN